MHRRDVKILYNIGLVTMRFLDPTARSLVPEMELDDSERKIWLDSIKAVRKYCATMHLHDSAAIADCLVVEYDNNRTRTVSDLAGSVHYFHNKLYAELDRQIFVQIDPDRVEFLKLSMESVASSSNISVVKNFNSALGDLQEAGVCFAVHRHTACVFHCMRVAEKGLRALATELQVPFAIPFEYENWQNIIEMTEKAIRGLEQKLPKGAAKSDKLKLYSEAATQFFYFKHAWRNHVAHARDTYDGTQAKTILEHVGQFMKYLAEGGLHD